GEVSTKVQVRGFTEIIDSLMKQITPMLQEVHQMVTDIRDHFELPDKTPSTGSAVDDPEDRADQGADEEAEGEPPPTDSKKKKPPVVPAKELEVDPVNVMQLAAELRGE